MSGMTLTRFEHGRGKGCVRKEFPYIRKPQKDYRLEAKWEEDDVKVLTLRTSSSAAVFSCRLKEQC